VVVKDPLGGALERLGGDLDEGVAVVIDDAEGEDENVEIGGSTVA